MSDFRIEDRGEGRFALGGEMSFANADRILRASGPVFAAHDDLEIDLSDVRKADSAGLALLLEWKSEARRRHARIRFRDIPQGLAAIARTTGVDAFL